ncbi:hypothetical protein D0T49_12950 [Paludibacter sp. 221]|uniref:hypothetical protein n=1 Tax=Paludibacter sp. 221 TaxID=2302939 RepID=UPI0013D6DE6A|nr:hypothetical protein [Paludibacter sp. 221]NDV47952.1 hypothetical protein [Paludibacter sp. 221]
MWKNIVTLFGGKNVLDFVFKFLLFAVVLICVIVFIRKRQKSGGSSGVSDADIPDKNGGVPTPKYAQSLANRLLVAMNRPGTNDKELIAVCEQLEKYPGLVTLTSQSFGYKKYFFGVRDDLLGASMDLWQWLDKELFDFGKDLELKERYRALFRSGGLI